MELDGMTALVTGGADGIGAGIAARLAAEGMHVVIADLDDRQGPITAERVGGSFVRTDLADRADALVAAGERKMRALVDVSDTQRIVTSDSRPLTNVNSGADLRALVRPGA